MCQEVDCGCGHSSHHGPRMQQHQGGCCGPSGHGQRRFPTREEVISELEEYLGNLQAEVQGVKERIAELKKEA